MRHGSWRCFSSCRDVCSALTGQRVGRTPNSTVTAVLGEVSLPALISGSVLEVPLLLVHVGVSVCVCACTHVPLCAKKETLRRECVRASGTC